MFYLLYKLEPEDEINVYYKGQRFKYRVTEKKVVSPKDVHYLTRKTTEETLTLQTCWPPGTILQRLLVFATPVSQ
ncbi:MAG: Sortase family protein [Microgenomates bacterium OLB22]|nr:MAG: Sortase family protein [Microgenomates bacterium OLB22]